MITRDEIFETINSGFRKVQSIEENGYMFDEHIYMNTAAYWWYCPYRGGEVRPTLQYQAPAYPEGPWFFAALTLNGVLVHEESRIVYDDLVREGIL